MSKLNHNELIDLYNQVKSFGEENLTNEMWRNIGKKFHISPNAAYKIYKENDWDRILYIAKNQSEQNVMKDGKVETETISPVDGSKQKIDCLLEERKEKNLQRYEIKKQNELLDKLATENIILEKITSAVSVVPPINPVEVKYPEGHKFLTRPQEAVLCLSDIHIGLAVNPNEVGNLGRYNIDIYKKRLNNLIKKVTSITEHHRNNSKLDTLHVFALGDVVHGSNDAGQWGFLHTEVNVMEQVFAGVQDLSKALLDLNQVYPKIKVYGIYGNHGRCLTSSTRILTENGYKKYNEIKKGDLVGTINPNSKKFEFQPIKEITIIEKEEKIIEHSNSNFFMQTTKDHDILFESKSGKLKKIKAHEIKKNKTGTFKIPISCVSENKEYKCFSDDELKLIGIIMSDGHYLPKTNSIIIYQSKEEKTEEIENLLNSLNLLFTKSTRDRDVEFIENKKLKSIKKENIFTISAKNDLIVKIRKLIPEREKVPSWMYNLSDRQVNLFLSGLIFGDGHIRPPKTEKDLCLRRGGIEALWGKKEFLEQLIGLFVSHGIPCSLSRHKGKTVNRENYYIQFRLSKSYSLKAKNTKEIEYNDLVWCVTVDNGTIAVLGEKGDAFFTGNCARREKEKRFVNWDYMVYHMMKMSLSQQKNISFEIPKSPFMVTEILGNKFLLTHGDQVRGWNGLPFYGMVRSETRFRTILERAKSIEELWDYIEKGDINQQDKDELLKYALTYAKSFDYMVMGHFHSMAELETNSGGRIILNSSFAGGDDYSINTLISANTAAQKFFGVHAEGKSWTYDIQLDRE